MDSWLGKGMRSFDTDSPGPIPPRPNRKPPFGTLAPNLESTELIGTPSCNSCTNPGSDLSKVFCQPTPTIIEKFSISDILGPAFISSRYTNSYGGLYFRSISVVDVSQPLLSSRAGSYPATRYVAGSLLTRWKLHFDSMSSFAES